MVNENALKRLRNVEGHVRGIQRMLIEEKYCIDIIRQINVVQAALNKVNTLVLNQHLNSCVITAVRGENPEEREQVLSEIEDIFEAATRV